MKTIEKINREGSMWEVLNIITPSNKRNLRDENPGYVFPLTDERINTVFHKKTEPKKKYSKKSSRLKINK